MALRDQAARGFALTETAAAVILGGFLLCGLLPENGFWGLNHLFFFPGAVKAILAILAVAVFMPQAAGLYVKTCSRLAALPPVIKKIGMILVPAALFILLRVAVHSLGDGYQRAFEIENGRMYSPTEMLDYLIHAIVYQLLASVIHIKAAVALAVTSIAIGIIFAATIFRLTPFAGEKRWAFLLLIFSLGSSQLFFGYVESYTLLYFAAVWYLLLIFQPPEKTASFGYVSAAYLLAGLAHQAGVILLPSYLTIAHFRYREHPRRFLIFPAILVLALLPALLPLGINQLLTIEPSRKIMDYFIPQSGTPYNLFSALHLFDILNQFLLVAPVVLMAIPYWPRLRPQMTRLAVPLALAAPAVLFIFVIDPVLTLARDWDLFAVPVVVAVFPLLVSLVKVLGDDRAALRRMVTIGLIAAVLTGSWIGINHSVEKNLARSEYILDHTVRGKRYGYELLAYYFSSHGDLPNELRMLQKIPQEEWTARIYAKISQSLYSQGHYEEAYDLAQKGVMLPNPIELNALMAGLTSYDHNEFPKAIHYLRIAADHWPNDPQVWCKLADALREADSLEAATQIYGRVLGMDNRLARPFFGMAFVSCKLKDYESARKFYEEGMRRDPSYSTAPVIEQMIRNRK
jgi:hypothetical protein